MCAGGSDVRRWHNAWEQWVLVETRDQRWHLVEYQAGDEGFDLGQPQTSVMFGQSKRS